MIIKIIDVVNLFKYFNKNKKNYQNFCMRLHLISIISNFFTDFYDKK